MIKKRRMKIMFKHKLLNKAIVEKDPNAIRETRDIIYLALNMLEDGEDVCITINVEDQKSRNLRLATIEDIDDLNKKMDSILGILHGTPVIPVEIESSKKVTKKWFRKLFDEYSNDMKLFMEEKGMLKSSIYPSPMYPFRPKYPSFLQAAKPNDLPKVTPINDPSASINKKPETMTIEGIPAVNRALARKLLDQAIQDKKDDTEQPVQYKEDAMKAAGLESTFDQNVTTEEAKKIDKELSQSEVKVPDGYSINPDEFKTAVKMNESGIQSSK